ncbi:MAG: response regulator transcription factor [Bacteroides sp.]|nr:response regulator transcription factor [Bacteroides sp.]MCM1550678.1 response regulator transcription factor [Clostridium sp.]
MKKIVMIEDDTDICKIVENFLTNYGYEVYFAQNGKGGVQLCRTLIPDLILLDLMLPSLSGNEVLEQIRAFTEIPVIVVSAKTMVQSKIQLLRSGADDYMTKPFDLYELLARIEANLKRSMAQTDETNLHLHYKDIEIKDSNIFVKGKLIPFTSTEAEILKLLLKYPQKIFSKQNIYESIWDEEYAYDDDTINTHISNIRKKIKTQTQDEYIETIWGIGYKLK